MIRGPITTILIPTLATLAPAQAPAAPGRAAPAPQAGTSIQLVGPSGAPVHTTLFPMADAALAGTAARAQRGAGSFLPIGEGIEGDQPMDVAIALGGSVVVTCLRDSNSLEFHAVLDGSRLGDVAVPAGPIDLDVTPDGARVLVACLDSDVVVAVDVATRALLSSTPVSARPFQVMALPDGVRAAVACDSGSFSGSLDVIDVQAGALVARGTTPWIGPHSATLSSWYGVEVERFPRLALSPDGTRVALPAYSDRSIWLYDTATAAPVVSHLGLGLSPHGATFAPNGQFVAFAATVFGGVSTAPNSIQLVDVVTGVRRTVAEGIQGFLSDLIVSPDGRSILYGSLGEVLKIDVSSGAVVDSAPAGEYGAEIRLAPGGTHALVTRAGFSLVEIATMDVVAEVPGMLFPRLAVDEASGVVAMITPSAGEDLEAFQVYSAGAPRLWSTPLGVPAEVDAPYAIDLTADEGTAVMACVSSRNLAVVDLETAALVRTIDLGSGCHDLAISPIADLAVCSLDETEEVAFVDLAAGAVISRFAAPGVPQNVFVTPDGARAVVRHQSGIDGIIDVYDLSGTSATLASRLAVPDATWHEAHLSPDGSTLALLAFDLVTFVDVASGQVRTTAPSVPFPNRGAWSTDSTRFLWSMNLFSTRVATLGAGAPTLQDVTGSDQVRRAILDDAGAYLYQLLSGARLRVVDMATGLEVQRLTLPALPGGVSSYFPRWMERVGDQLLIVRNESDAAIYRIALDGPQTSLIERVDMETEGTYDIAHARSRGLVLMPASIMGDGIRFARYGGSWSSECGPAVVNSTGNSARMEASGPLVADGPAIELVASQLPPMTFGMFVVSRSAGTVTPPGSQGTLCLGGAIGRYLGSVQSSGPAGVLRHSADPGQLPITGGTVGLPGDSLLFQAWFRDANPGATSNFTDAARVELR